MTPTEKRPQECEHYCHYLGDVCTLDIKETNVLGGGFWIKCCDLVDDPEYICPDYEPKETDRERQKQKPK